MNGRCRLEHRLVPASQGRTSVRLVSKRLAELLSLSGLTQRKMRCLDQYTMCSRMIYQIASPVMVFARFGCCAHCLLALRVCLRKARAALSALLLLNRWSDSEKQWKELEESYVAGADHSGGTQASSNKIPIQLPPGLPSVWLDALNCLR